MTWVLLAWIAFRLAFLLRESLEISLGRALAFLARKAPRSSLFWRLRRHRNADLNAWLRQISRRGSM